MESSLSEVDLAISVFTYSSSFIFCLWIENIEVIAYLRLCSFVLISEIKKVSRPIACLIICYISVQSVNTDFTCLIKRVK